MANFHNPYNFVPALPRDSVTGYLGDCQPVGHQAYMDDRWSGTIAVKLTTKTPLLIPDAAVSEDKNGHKTYGLRMLGDKPDLPLTSVKGMLRSAYEAVTNSRLSVFVKHDERLAYRSPASGSNNFYPAIVAQRKDGSKILRILEGEGLLGRVGRLPRYRKSPGANEWDKGESEFGLCYEGTTALPLYRDAVWVRLNPGHQYETDIPTKIRDQLSKKPLLDNVVTRIKKREKDSLPPGDGDWRKGWVYITGANINGKIYERVFLEPEEGRAPTVRVDDRLERLWTELITDYQEQKQHKKDITNRSLQNPPRSAQDYLGKEPGKTAYSRHIYTSKAKHLTKGTLCYVQLQDDHDMEHLSPRDVVALLPVTISRRLYDTSPASLLDRSLHPANSMTELSPSDRVFGWVRQNGQGVKTQDATGAYKGQLRLHGMECVSADPVQSFGDEGFPLAILGQPKPQQARFYAAKNKKGEALEQRVSKEEGYQEESQGLRGRKVYPHHQNLPDGHWDHPERDRTQQDNKGHYQEYRRPQKSGKEQRDDQNRSIKAWVKPDREFRFKIDVENLSDVELGALLYLLSLPPDHYHRLGGGKPLGFGSVRLEWDADQTDLRRGKDWRCFYSSLLAIQDADPKSKLADLDGAIAAYREAVSTSYRSRFEKVSFIAAFEKSTLGYGKPVHYPRTTLEPKPDGESFKWFVDNEATPHGEKLSLPDLTSDRTLPINPTTAQSSSTRRR
jgi:CRISPR-associated protein (TIGR03986 family)